MKSVFLVIGTVYHEFSEVLGVFDNEQGANDWVGKIKKTEGLGYDDVDSQEWEIGEILDLTKKI